MDSLIQPLLDFLHALSEAVPIEIFTFVGAFIEELIAPIPSPIVLTLSGSLAASQHRVMVYLLVLAIIGSVAKTIGSVIIYIIADKAEDFFVDKFGRFFGVSHDDIEGIGKHLNNDWRDDVILTIIRSIPVMPSSPIAATCGLIKINMRTFIMSTFLGSIIRNLFFLYIGYTSLEAVESLGSGYEAAETLTKYIVVLGGLGFMLIWLYKKRQENTFMNQVMLKAQAFIQKLHSFFQK